MTVKIFEISAIKAPQAACRDAVEIKKLLEKLQISSR